MLRAPRRGLFGLELLHVIIVVVVVVLVGGERENRDSKSRYRMAGVADRAEEPALKRRKKLVFLCDIFQFHFLGSWDIYHLPRGLRGGCRRGDDVDAPDQDIGDDIDNDIGDYVDQPLTLSAFLRTAST